MESKRIEIGTLFSSLTTVLTIEVAMRVVISNSQWHPMIALGVARLIETSLIILIVLVSGKGLSSIGLAGSKIAFGLKKGLVWSAGVGLVACFGFGVLFFFGIDALTLVRTPLPIKTAEIVIFFFIGGLVAPVAEEVFFRGMLYGFFRRWGAMVAIILSTLIFVLFHPMSQGVPITQVVGGLVFALAYEIEGSLLVPIFIHGLGNLAIFTLSLIF